MAFDFPNSPVEGQEYLAPAGPVYKYSGGKWDLLGGSLAPTPLVGFRNIIQNGDFSIDQRYNGAGVTISAGGVPIDRWNVSATAPGQINAQRRVQDPPRTSEYMMVLWVAVADASLAAADHYSTYQSIEGNMLRGLNWGGSQAQTITISFEASSSSPFILPLSIRNGAANRSWVGSFATSTSIAKYSITIPGDVIGTWTYDNAVGMYVTIELAAGTTYTGVAGWQAGNIMSMAGMTNFMASTANALYIRNFQLELGLVATEFERVPYADQLARCQRYYQKTNQTGAGYANGVITLAWPYAYPVDMRVVPTFVGSGSNNNTTGATFIPNTTSGGYLNAVGAAAGGFICGAAGALNAEI